jgi:hypothetical protein
MKFDFLQIFEKYSNLEFHENPSSGRWVVPCGWTDRHDKANSRFSQFCESAEKFFMHNQQIYNAGYPDRLGPSGKSVENFTELTCLEITGYGIKYRIVLRLLELQIRRGRKVGIANSNSRISDCQYSLFSKKNPITGFSTYPDGSPSQLCWIIGVLLYLHSRRFVPSSYGIRVQERFKCYMWSVKSVNVLMSLHL